MGSAKRPAELELETAQRKRPCYYATPGPGNHIDLARYKSWQIVREYFKGNDSDSPCTRMHHMDIDTVIQVITTEIDKSADTPGAKDYAKETETSQASKSPSKEELYGYLLCTERFLVDAAKKTDRVKKVAEILHLEIQYIGNTMPQDKRFDYVADTDIDMSSDLYQSLLQAVEKQCKTEEDSVRKAIKLQQEKLAKISSKYNEVVKKRYKQKKLLDSARRLYPTLFDMDVKEGNTAQDRYKRTQSCQRDGRIEKRPIKSRKHRENGKVGVFARSDDAAKFLKEVLTECIASGPSPSRLARPNTDKNAPRQPEKIAVNSNNGPTREVSLQKAVESAILPDKKVDMVMAVDEINEWVSVNPFDDTEIAVETQNSEQVDAASLETPQVVPLLVPKKRMARAIKIQQWAMRGSKASSSSPRRSNPEPVWVVEGSTMSWLTDQASAVSDTRVGGRASSPAHPVG